MGSLRFVWQDVWVLRHWGRLPWWGGLRTPRYHGPPGCLSKRRQGGPWAPPPCGVNSPGKLSWSLSGICSGSSGCLSVLCEVFVISQGSVFLFWTVEPFTTRPVSGLYLPVPFFFLSGLFVDAVCSLSLSLSLSLRRWGTPNLFGLGFPLCFSILDTLLAIDPYIVPYTYPQVTLPLLFFFFCRRSRWVVGGVWFPGWGLGSVGVLVWCFGRSWLLVFVLLRSCISSCTRTTAMPVFRPQWRLTPFLPLIGSSWVTRLLLGVDPGTVRSAAGRGCRRHCDPTQLLGTTIIIMTALPGHRRPPPQQTPAISSVPGFVGGLLFFVCHVTLRFRLHFLHLSLALDRQPYCHTLSCASGQFFSPSRRGKCCPFLSFGFFRAWLGVFCRFFPFVLS